MLCRLLTFALFLSLPTPSLWADHHEEEKPPRTIAVADEGAEESKLLSVGELENVILAPHSIAWTDELFRDIGRTACRGLLDLSQGQRPLGVVNPELFDNATFNDKWERIRLASP